jgi:hypothetical protein
MAKKPKLTDDALVARIHFVRGQKVMLDRDLAQLYNVQTRDLNKAAKRNIRRFPPDFMFRLKTSETKNLMFQIGTSSWGGTRKLPYAFTEQGIAMLSSVLRSERAIQVNIHIVRVFTRLRQFLLNNKDILRKLDQLENRLGKHDEQIQAIFQYMKDMFNPPDKPMRKIGFRQRGRETTLLLK